MVSWLFGWLVDPLKVMNEICVRNDCNATYLGSIYIKKSYTIPAFHLNKYMRENLDRNKKKKFCEYTSDLNTETEREREN